MRKTVYSQSQLVISLATSFDVRDEISRVVLGLEFARVHNLVFFSVAPISVEISVWFPHSQVKSCVRCEYAIFRSAMIK